MHPTGLLQEPLIQHYITCIAKYRELVRIYLDLSPDYLDLANIIINKTLGYE